MINLALLFRHNVRSMVMAFNATFKLDVGNAEFTLNKGKGNSMVM